MAEITKIEFWNDVGFIDGAVEIPSLSAADPINPDIILAPTDPIVPSKDRFFTEIKIKAYYSELLTVSYMRVTVDLKDSLQVDVPHTFYGWVDSVEIVSDGSLPNTVIRWHIDEWRTWKSAVTFGSGHIKRRPYIDLASTPIQNYPVRFYKRGATNIDLFSAGANGWTNITTKVWWVIVSYNDSWSISGYTSLEALAFPIFGNGNECYLKWGTNEVRQTLKWSDISRGLIDERLGIPGSAIVGAWLSPICPFQPGYNQAVSGDGSFANPFVVSGTSSIVQVKEGGHNADPGDPYKYFYARILGTYGNYTNNYLGSTKISSEEERFIIEGMDGDKVLELPYGYSVGYYTLRSFVNGNEGYMQLILSDVSYPSIEENLVGLVVNIPYPSIPINTNAWADYTYSGQREYDRESRVVQSQANAWKSSAAGGGTGAMMGAFGPVGLAVGTLGGVTGGLVGYGVESLWQNDKEQEMKDRLMANQLSSLVLSTNALEPFVNSTCLRMRSLVPDDYSAGLITDTRAQFGVSVDELVTSCDTLIRTSAPTGYYNIQNLIVSGDIPVSAKRWIREKFRAGVRLI